MYINILFIVIMLVAVIMIVKQKELNNIVKGFVIILFLAAVALASLFEYISNQKEEAIRPVILAFKQGKTLNCQNYDMNQSTYTYEPGTSTFQPKIGVVGVTYHPKECMLSQ